ncbi:MAG: hypothetical protein GY775_16780 [Candidatus Scalindua sp.]|nr:hypothetical protein [Candidatus Scalindua sp.]
MAKKETPKATLQTAKVITAVNKLDKVLGTIPATLEDIKTLKSEAAAKTDINVNNDNTGRK